MRDRPPDLQKVRAFHSSQQCVWLLASVYLCTLFYRREAWLNLGARMMGGPQPDVGGASKGCGPVVPAWRTVRLGGGCTRWERQTDNAHAYYWFQRQLSFLMAWQWQLLSKLRPFLFGTGLLVHRGRLVPGRQCLHVITRHRRHSDQPVIAVAVEVKLMKIEHHVLLANSEEPSNACNHGLDLAGLVDHQVADVADRLIGRGFDRCPDQLAC